jgi:hypothetical protein
MPLVDKVLGGAIVVTGTRAAWKHLTSGGWLATGWVIGIVVFTSILGAVSPSSCKGGIDLTVPPSYESSDGKHWIGTFTCMNGGTMTNPVPAGQVPGGG